MAFSALESLSQLEHSYKNKAVVSPEFEAEVMLWAGTSLSIAGVPLLIGEGELEEVIETPELTQIPGTKPWVMGVAGHKGALLPILNGDVLFRKQPYSGRIREHCMVVRRPGLYFGITLSDIERDLKFPIEQRDMDYPVDPDLAEFSLGGFHYRDRFLAILDIDKLVADANFLDASTTNQDSTEEKTDEQ